MSLADKYRELVLRLFPRGRAWAGEMGTVFFNLCEGAGVEFSRFEEASKKLLEELDPRTTTELITEWESLVGLPDDCQEIASSLAQRRLDVYRKYVSKGGASRAFFIELASRIGYVITISEKPHQQARCGVARCGDRLYGPLWLFWWQVIVPDFTISVARSGVARCGDRLTDFQNQKLECVIQKAKPAHTFVQFVYGS